MTRRARGDDLGAIAEAVHRLSVVLAAGIAPRAAWGYLAASSSSESRVTAVVRTVAEGASTEDLTERMIDASAQAPSLEREAWAGVASAWSVATELGAPLAGSLADLAVGLRELAEARRDATVALAGPIATARLVLLLPIVGMLFGMALGVDTVTTLIGTPFGWCCLAAGAVLIVAALLWMRMLVRRAAPASATPGLTAELLAIAVSGGGALDRARRVVDETCGRFAITDPASDVESAVALSQAAGVPAAALLRAHAAEGRRTARAAAQAAAARLGVVLMLPLGVCILPAFLALGVLPLIATIVLSTAEGLM